VRGGWGGVGCGGRGEVRKVDLRKLRHSSQRSGKELPSGKRGLETWKGVMRASMA
jgi:hypothetical protein